MIRRLLIVGSILAAIGLVIFSFFWITIHTPIEPREANISIEKGRTLRQIARDLEEKGILRQGWAFVVYAHLLGKQNQLKAGDYAFEKISLSDVLDHLVKGMTIQYKVPLIAGWTLVQTIHHIGALTFIKDPNFAATLRQLASDKIFIASLGINAASLEGYLLPDTYYFSPKTTPKDYLETFVKAFKKNYEGVGHEIVTMASMVEKETGNEAERPIIASVFYNRLKKGCCSRATRR